MPRVLQAFYDWSDQRLFWSFAALSILALVTGVFLEHPLPVLLPIGILFVLFTVHSPKNLYYLFFGILPFSIEVHIGSFGTDLPSEPIMVAMMGMTIVILLSRGWQLGKALVTHPITLLLVLHLLWTAFTGLYSTNQVMSFKYFLAKLWYVLPFYVLPLFILKEEKDYRRLFSILSMGMFVAITYVLLRHAAEGFSFASSNTVMRPIFRNHVSYAIMLVVLLPFYWYLIRTSRTRYKAIMYGFLVLLLVAIYFSFTRAAQASVILAIGFYWVLKWRLMKLAIGSSVVLITCFVLFLTVGNRYLDYAPNFERAVAHKKFDNLLDATLKMEDVSTVERFYRWVAGGYMLKEKPWLGYGPATFYSQYQSHTVTSYKTWVSDNPEKSGIHNYYLMVAVEQGVIGFIILVSMIFCTLLYAEQVYHRLKSQREKALLMATTTAFFLINVANFINDLVETDKIGPFFFMAMAIIMYYDARSRKENTGNDSSNENSNDNSVNDNLDNNRESTVISNNTKI